MIFKKIFIFFSLRGKRIAMAPPKVKLQLPKPMVKVGEMILKAEVVEVHVGKNQRPLNL